MTPCFPNRGRANRRSYRRPITLRPPPLRLLLAGAGLFLLARTGSVAKPNWDPISPADLAAKDSPSSPGVDAEILFSRCTLDTDRRDLLAEHYVRAKIYTQKGVEDRGKLNIEGRFEQTVERVAAQIIKVDGTVISLKKTDFMESAVVKVGDIKLTQIAFVFPNLAPGDVVEYRWTGRLNGWYVLTHFLPFFCQEELPVREFTFAVENYVVNYSLLWLNCPGAELKKTGLGMVVTVRNLPPFEEEEAMPPERDYRAWVMIVGNDSQSKNGEQWQRVSEIWDEKFRDSTTPTLPVKALASRLVAGAANDAEKLRRLYEFCQKEIANLWWNDTPELREAKRLREKSGSRQKPQETVEKRCGTAGDIDYLFAGLARAAGFEVKLARNASRTDLFNINIPKGWDFLDRELIAVRTGGRWQFFTPGRYWVPCGMLDWRDEGVTALLCDSRKVLFEDTTVSPAEVSQLHSKGRFALDAEGTLEGSVEQAMTGHLAVDVKAGAWNKAADVIDRDLREQVAKRLPTAEVSDVHWQNLGTLGFPVTVRYHVRVPGYAERAGSRLVLAPSFFVAGRPARFAPAKRKYPVVFPRAWAEYDDIEIVLPEGFEMEQASAPPNVGNPDTSLGATFAMGYAAARRLLVYQRHFALGGNRALGCRPENYPGLRRLFESIHESDTQAIMLRRTGAVPVRSPAVELEHPESVPGVAQ